MYTHGKALPGVVIGYLTICALYAIITDDVERKKASFFWPAFVTQKTQEVTNDLQ